MPRENVSLHTFNRGLISPLALARTDIERVGLSAETMDNWMPRNLGSMMLRPGAKYIGATASNNAAKFIPFVYATNDTALIELTDVLMRVWDGDSLVSREVVSTSITNGTFDSDVTSWTDDDDSGGTSAWVTGGYMGLTGDGTNYARMYQEVTISTGDSLSDHAVTIVIERGPVLFKAGSTANDDDYITATYLEEGTHSLNFTAAGTSVFFEFSSATKRQMLVDSIAIESSGTMTVAAPWAAADLDNIRYDQSADVVYVACATYQQYKIERRSNNSWSVVKYKPLNGPFRAINITPITITASDISGNVTLTASQPLFKSTHVGALFRCTSEGQTVSSALSAENTFTNTIKVTGTVESRIFQLTISGRTDSTITLQRSFTSSTGPWEDVNSYTADTTVSIDDGFDNQVVWYQLGIKTGDYGTDTVTCTLDFALGSIDGIARITAFSTDVSVSAEVIQDFGDADATDDWYEGEWSDYRGWPTAVAFAEGRLGWSGKDKVILSASDAFEDFDDLDASDSSTISRTIGSGPVDNINWMVAARRLVLGADGSEFALRASSEDEPLTYLNAHMKSFSTQGSSNVEAKRIDDSVIFIQRGGTRVMEAAFGEGVYDYQTGDLTTYYPEAGSSQIVRIGVQRQPDTRIHCVRSDGTVAIMVYDKAENVSCWVTYSTDGTVEDVVVLPGADGTGEDDVYYVVNRTINSATVRYLEKWALESQCEGGTVNRNLDSFLIYSGSSTTSMTGLDHLEGETVYVWGGGKDLGSYTVSGGAITLSEAVTDACIGLTYTAQFKSAKLAYAAGLGSPLTQKKRIARLAVILRNTHYQGLDYGPSFTASEMDTLPLMKDGKLIADDTVHTEFDEESFSFPGEWDGDSRLCLEANAPKPVNVVAAIMSIETHDSY